MNHESLALVTLFSVLIIFFLFIFLRILKGINKKKIEAKSKETGEVGFVVDTFHDLVSKLKEKEKELEHLKKAAEEKASAIEIYNENIFQSVPSGVVSFDQELSITSINSAAEQMLDLRGMSVTGRKYNEILNDPIAELIENRKTIERAEISYVTSSGKRMWLGLTISPLKNSSGDIIGQILVFTDLTELKAFQSQMELRDRLSTLGEMSAGIAHELRNPMAVISGYTKILLKKVDDASLPAVESISREVAVMDRIITDFLSFAKPTEVMPAKVDLKELVEICVKTVTEDHEKINILMNIDGLPVIHGDDVLLRQAVTNLIQNAVESMADSGELRVEGDVSDVLFLSVSDTGHGIPENIKDKIFLPFYTTKEKGTGLGLPIVHKIVVSHGGTIKVQTNDKGTTFTIEMPKEMIAG